MKEEDYISNTETFKRIIRNGNYKLLKDLVKIVHCKIPLKQKKEDDDLVTVKCVMPRTLPSHGYINTFESCKANSEAMNKIKDRLLSNDILITSIGKMGKVCLVPEFNVEENILCHRSLITLRVKNDDLNPKAIYMFLKSEEVQEYLLKRAYNHDRPQLFARYILEMPFPMEQHDQLIEKFDRVTELYAQIDNAEKEILEVYSYNLCLDS